MVRQNSKEAHRSALTATVPGRKMCYEARLTLIQTRKIKPFPVVLFDSKYWSTFLDWLQNSALARGFISEEDFNLPGVCDRADELIETVQ